MVKQKKYNFSRSIIEIEKKEQYKLAIKLPDQWGNFIVKNKKNFSYDELLDHVASFQAGIKKEKLQAGDRVIILFPPSIELYISLIALLASGLVPTFIDTGMGLKKIIHSISLAKPKAIISSDALLKYHWFLPALWKVKKYSVDKKHFKIAPLSDLFGSGELFTQPCEQQSPALISFTSGSTGAPKGADRSHNLLIAQSQVIADAFPFIENDILLTTFPISILHNLSHGITTILPNMDFRSPANVEPKLIVNQIDEHQITLLSGPPAFLVKITQYLQQQQRQISHIRGILTGGAPIQPFIYQQLQSVFPKAEIYGVYGSTEAEPIAKISANHALIKTNTTQYNGYPVGYVIAPTQVKIEADNSNDSEGEILVRGPHVLQRYIHQPLESIDPNAWHHTGDTGYFDEDQCLWLTGRLKDRVQLEGKRISPYPLEREIRELEQIDAAALINDDKNNAFLCLQSNTKDQILITQINALFEKFQLTNIKLKWLTIPMDGRHNSKVNRPLLRKTISTMRS